MRTQILIAAVLVLGATLIADAADDAAAEARASAAQKVRASQVAAPKVNPDAREGFHVR